jgi:hypothetical protein
MEVSEEHITIEGFILMNSITSYETVCIRKTAIIRLEKQVDIDIQYRICLFDSTITWTPGYGDKNSIDKIDSQIKELGLEYSVTNRIDKLETITDKLEDRLSKLEKNMDIVISHLETLLVVTNKRLATDDPLLEY